MLVKGPVYLHIRLFPERSRIGEQTPESATTGSLHDLQRGSTFSTPQQVYVVLSHTTRDGFVYYGKDTFTFRRQSYLGGKVR